MKIRLLAATALIILPASMAFAQDINPPEDQVQPPKAEYSPFVDDHFPTQPLDFVVVSDHAESFGLLDFIERSDPMVLKIPLGKQLHDLVKAGNNLHRVVIFRDNKDRADQVIPMSSFDSNNPEDLWKYMAAYEEKAGGRILATAHNGNLSNGMMFDTRTYEGRRLTRAYAETRSRFEPIYEMTQAKGTGEAHPALSPIDPSMSIYGSGLSAAGLAAVWARENTREAIWDAMQRREVYERIYDVTCSDGRAIVERRCEHAVGSTVDLSGPSYTNTIGDPLLTAHWVDPDFDADQRAFYYVRVIEIPKPRWTAYDTKFFGIDMPDDVAMTVQDRAYTSPIWYTP